MSQTQVQPAETFVERFDQFQILRYQVPGFASLPLARKRLLYYLYEASLHGRDIIWDQNYTHNLRIRSTLEAVVRHYDGNRETPAFQQFMVYVKKVWFANGVHHHYSGIKFTPEMETSDFEALLQQVPAELFPLQEGQALQDFITELSLLIFDPTLDAKKTSKDQNADRVQASAVNYYQDVTEAEVNDFYAARMNDEDDTPVSHGLNSRLEKVDGVIQERVWKVGGMYDAAIRAMVHWLTKAAEVAETPAQADVLHKLIAYYESGDLSDFDDYSIAWVKDTTSEVDLMHGFIESYNDPLGYRGSFEAILSVKDPEGTRRIQAIADAAQWFEDHSPVDDAHRREAVSGMAGAAINVVVESGDSSPATPIGVNLPNADWIRERHGSKSVNLANVVAAYNQVAGALKAEFTYTQEERDRQESHGVLADDLHTDLHEVIGHGSGKLETGVATPKETLKHYASTLEEARADLVALYFLYDSKLVELGLMPSLDVGKTAYDDYIHNGLMIQLRRLGPGEDLEEDHMRNRQLIAAWAFEKGQGVIERLVEEGKTYFVIRDYEALRELFGDLLREVQRIKSQGDFEAGRQLVETYGVRVDAELRDEVVARFEKLGLAAYSGFLNPKLTPIYEDGELIDVTLSHAEHFTAQMLDYSRLYGHLAP